MSAYFCMGGLVSEHRGRSCMKWGLVVEDRNMLGG